MPKIAVGDRAPDFSAVSQTGKLVSLADYRGQQAVVLYFYPRDGTPACTAQACEFRDTFAAFAAAGAAVLGVSCNSADRHQSLAVQYQLPFLLLSDADGSLRKVFGVPKLFGFLPGRTTFVIDKEGIVRHVYTNHFSVRGHIEEALRAVRELES